MNLELTDKVFIISGASRGIGKGIADVLLQENANVAITGLDPEEVHDTYKEFNEKYPGKIIECGGDLNEKSTLLLLETSVRNKWGRIDGLVANAGAVKPVASWEIPDADWEWYFEANFKLAVRFVTHFIPYLKETRGAIVFIGSIAGLEDIGAPLPYSVSKTALTMYAKGLARKLAPDSIRVNTIAPGNIIFPGGNWDNKRKANPEGIEKMLKEKVPLKRFGTPHDIGNLAAVLVSDKAGFITGSCIVIDGGQTTFFV
jgi:3-oxoacyl-[acyl-carrier protein] reductase